MQASPNPQQRVFNAMTVMEHAYPRIREIVMRQAEQDYIRRNSRLQGEPRAWGETESHPGPWQRPGTPQNPVPPAPLLDWNAETRPYNWWAR
jgi:hypothetical protein